MPYEANVLSTNRELHFGSTSKYFGRLCALKEVAFDNPFLVVITPLVKTFR